MVAAATPASAPATPVSPPAQENVAVQTPPPTSTPAKRIAGAPVSIKDFERNEAQAPGEGPRTASAENLSSSAPDAPAPARNDSASRDETSPKSATAKSVTSQAEHKPKAVAAKRASSSKHARDESSDERGRDDGMPPLAVGSMRAKFVGTTPEGKWILALPNSQTVVVPPPPIATRGKDSSRRRVQRALPVEEPVVAEPVPEPQFEGEPVPGG
jgi:hypothetical protein